MEISKHAKERYVERVVGITDTNGIVGYLMANEDLVNERIEKAVTFGKLIYTGALNGHKGAKVYCNTSGLIAIVATNADLVITIYQIDFGLGEEFNELYVTNSLEKLEKLEEELIAIEEDNSRQFKEIEEEKEINKEAIKRYNILIKQLENRNKALDEVRGTLTTKRSIKESDIKDLVEGMTRKK